VEEIDFIETGHFQPRSADLRTLPKNYLSRVGLALKLYQDPLVLSKLIQFFNPDRDTKIDAHPPIHRQVNF